jgi:hypothetical protein
MSPTPYTILRVMVDVSTDKYCEVSSRIESVAQEEELRGL